MKYSRNVLLWKKTLWPGKYMIISAKGDGGLNCLVSSGKRKKFSDPRIAMSKFNER